MKRILVLMLFAMAAPAAAQQPEGHQSRYTMKHDMFGQYLFPPELIMQRQAEIGLRDNQRDQIRAELQKAQSTFTDVQWKIASETEKLEKLLQTSSIDETRVLTQVDAILQLEREVKRTHITLLVRIRNALTEQQRDKLTQLQR